MDGSCWSKVIAASSRRASTAPVCRILWTHCVASEAARRAIAAQSGPTVLVGHSFSGMIVSEGKGWTRRSLPRLRRCAGADAGEDYTALAKTYPAPRHSWHCLQRRLGPVIGERFLHDFAGDLPPEEARVLYAVQQPFKKSLTAETTTSAAWRKPSFYAVSTQDRTINPDLSFMAKRMGCY